MNKKVLIAEDEGTLANLISDFLTEYKGYDVVGLANNGEKAVELFKKYRPGIVIMDLIMPKQSGNKAIESILALQPDTNIIVITAIVDKQFRKDIEKLGVKMYIEKPFRLKELVSALEELN